METFFTGDSNKLDGKDSSEFADVNHNHDGTYDNYNHWKIYNNGTPLNVISNKEVDFKGVSGVNVITNDDGNRITVSSSADFEGSGSADTIARSDHDHSGTYDKYNNWTISDGFEVRDIESGNAVVFSGINGLATRLTDLSAQSDSFVEIEPVYGGNGSANSIARSDHTHSKYIENNNYNKVVSFTDGDGKSHTVTINNGLIDNWEIL